MRKNSEKAVIALYDEQKRFLLQDRFGISGSGEEWGFFGGGIEAGETDDQALKREIMEELGVQLTSFKYLTTYKAFRNDGETFNEVHLFVGPLGDQLAHAKQQEGRDMKLFSVAELKKLNLGRTDADIARCIEKYLLETR